MGRRLNAETATEILDRLRAIPEDRAPKWGKFTLLQMFGHLNSTIQYTLGNTPLLPFVGNFKTQYIFAPLILNGIRAFPHDVRLPRAEGRDEILKKESDVDEIAASIEAFLERAEKPRFHPPHHPFFGNIGAVGWSKFHYGHMDHHLKQFGE